jgi:type 1 glutamine amidotransferase
MRSGMRSGMCIGVRARVRTGMRFSVRARVVAAVLGSVLTLLTQGCVEATPAPLDVEPARALVFSRTTGFRHASIPAGIVAIESIGAAHALEVEATEDPAAFTAANLARFRVVIFLNTTGDVLDAPQQAAFEQYITAGGGFAGVHSAADTEYAWPWYGDLVGAYFQSHPAIQSATIHVVDATHPATQGLPPAVTRTDEWYDFQSVPAPDVRILLRVDEDTYSGGVMGDPHPISWSRALGNGRAWYTAMGHTSESYAEPLFLHHLAGGILWAAGLR